MALTKITRGLLNTGVSDSSDATAITIDANENVGIGTTSPSKKLHVKGDEIVLEDPGGGFKLELNADTNPVTITANDNTGANYCGFKLKTNNGGAYPVTAMDVYPHGGASVAFGAGARTDTQMLISRAPSSATQTTPETILVLSTPCTSTSSNIPVGQGPRIVFEIPDDQAGNKATGAAIAALKEIDSDVNSQTSLAFYTSDDDETLDQNMSILSDGKVGIGTTGPNEKLEVAGNLTLTPSTKNNSPSANATISNINFVGRTDNTVVAKIEAIHNDNANGTDGQILFYTADNTSSAAAAEKMRIDSTGNLKFNSGFGSVGTAYGVRAWVNVNQTTHNIRDSGNVTSVSDEGTALYKVNFTNAMPDTNYALLGTASNENNLVGIDGHPPSTYTTSAVEVRIFDASNVGQELTNGILNVVIIR